MSYSRDSLTAYWKVYGTEANGTDNLLAIAEGGHVLTEELIEEADSMTDAMHPDVADNEGRVVIDIQSVVPYEEIGYSTSEEQKVSGEDGVISVHPDEIDTVSGVSVGAEAGKETRVSDGIQLEIVYEQTSGAAGLPQQIVDVVVPDLFCTRPEEVDEEVVDGEVADVADDEYRIVVDSNEESDIAHVRSSGLTSSAEGVTHSVIARSTEANITKSYNDQLAMYGAVESDTRDCTVKSEIETPDSAAHTSSNNLPLQKDFEATSNTCAEGYTNPSDQNTIDSTADGKPEDISVVNRSGEDIKATRSPEDENTIENINPSDQYTFESSADGKTEDIVADSHSGDDIKATRSPEDDTTEENVNPSDQSTIESSADGKTEDIVAVSHSGQDIKATRSSEHENTEENINPPDQTTIESSADGKTEDIVAVSHSGDDIKATWSSEHENTIENINPSDQSIIESSADVKTEDIVAVNHSGDDIKATRSPEDENTIENINPSDQSTIESRADGKTGDIVAVNRSGDDIKATRSPEDDTTEENINISDQSTIESSADGKTGDIVAVNRSGDDIKATRSPEDGNATEVGTKLGIDAEAGYTQDGSFRRVEDVTLETNALLRRNIAENVIVQQQQTMDSVKESSIVTEELDRDNETTDVPRRMLPALEGHTDERSEELPLVDHVNIYDNVNDVFTTVM